MNRELLGRVRDRIAEVGDEGSDMNSWVGVPRGPDGTLRDAIVTLSGKGDCGTTGCIAGHAVAITTGSLTYIPIEQLFTDGDGRQYDSMAILAEQSVAGRAAELLDIDPLDAHRLFHHDYWPQRHQDVRTDEGNAKGMITVIDDLLSGRITFEDGLLVEVDE